MHLANAGPTALEKSTDMIIATLKKLNRLARRTAARASAVRGALSMLRDPVWSKTRYPGERLKGRARVTAENLAWAVRHGEANRFYWLYGLDRLGGPDPSEYIAYNEFKEIRNRKNRIAGIGAYYSDYTAVLKDKFVFNRILDSLRFPTPRLIAVCIDGKMWWFDDPKETGIEDIASRGGVDMYCKTLLGECADGVYHLTGGCGVLLCDGEEIDTGRLEELTSGAFLLQERIEQHPEMSRLYPNSINTIRLVTIMGDAGPSLFAASIRTGASGNTRDNWAVGGLSGGIDLETGRLGRWFDFKPGYGGRTDTHPDSGVVFGEFTVPMFDAAKRMALGLHSFLYGIQSVGWDMAITPGGPVFIEGNDNWEITPHQIIDGGLRRRFLEAAGVSP